MAYGTVKVDNITFTNGGIDQTVTVSGIVQSISGNITATGTIQGETIIGTSTVSGATVTGDAGVFTTVTGGSAGFTTITGATVTGTTANFVNGTFSTQVSGTTVRGTTVSGATVTGAIGQFTTLTGGTAGFTTVTGTTVTGTTANFQSGVFTTQISGATVTGNVGSFSTITGGTVTLTSGVFGTGTAAAPSIAFTGDSNTGIYSPGADQVALSTNGTGRLFVDASGNVGVGTAPSQLLHVAGDSATALVAASAGTGAVRITRGATTFEAGATTSTTYVGTTSATDFQLRTGGTERLRITSAGLVGVGTSAPGSTLHVQGDTFSTTGFRTGSTPSSLSGQLVNESDTTKSITLAADPGNVGASTFLGFAVDGSERARIDSSGRVGIGTSSPEEKLEVAGAILTSGPLGSHKTSKGVFEFYSNVTIIRSYGATAGTGQISFETGGGGGSTGSPAMRIDASGRVGIGTTSPSSLLTLRSDSASAATAIRLENLNASGGVTTQSVGISAVFDYNNGGSVAGAGSITFGKEGTYTTSTAEVDSYLGFATTLNNSTTEKCRITSDGKLLVGTSTSLGNNALLQTSGSQVGYQTFHHQDAQSGPFVILSKSRGSQASPTAVTNNDYLGLIGFSGYDGTDYATRGAEIACQVDGTPGANDMPGRLVFSTTADGASSPTERMRITSDAYVRLASGAGGIQFNGDTAAGNALDDYEEGTWTPEFAGETTAGTYTYGSRSGIYTKIGNVVIASFSLVNINTSSAGLGTAMITGLPYTSTATFSYNSTVPRFDNFDLGSSDYVTCLVDNNSTRIKFFTVTTNASDNVLSVTAKNSDTSDAFGTVVYLTS